MAVGAFIIYLLLKMDKRIEKIEDDLSKKRDVEQCNQCHRDIKDSLKAIFDKLEVLNSDYVSREDYYGDISGWRTEISNLNQRINEILLYKGKL